MGQDVYVAPPPPRQSRNWSCCLWGCLIAFIVFVLAIIALVLVARKSIEQLRENYTSSTPQPLPVVEVGQPTVDALISRVDTFADHVEKDEPASPLKLTQDEINTLIHYHPDWSDLRDKVYVSIEDDAITGEVNFPLDGVPMMAGRFVHGSATFDVSLENGRLEVYIVSATVNGEPLPSEFMGAMRTENLAKEFRQNNPKAQAIIDKLESIKIEDGLLVITPKKLLPEDEAAPATGSETAAPPAEAPPPEDNASASGASPDAQEMLEDTGSPAGP